MKYGHAGMLFVLVLSATHCGGSSETIDLGPGSGGRGAGGPGGNAGIKGQGGTAGQPVPNPGGRGGQLGVGGVGGAPLPGGMAGAASVGGMGGMPADPGAGGVAGTTPDPGSGGMAPQPQGPEGILAHAPFDGAAGPLDNLVMGSGFASNWSVQNGIVKLPGYAIALSPPLTFSNLASSAPHAIGGFEYHGSGVRLDMSPSGPFRAYVISTSQAIGAPGTTLWMSALMRKEVGSGNAEIVTALHGSEVGFWDKQEDRPSAVAFGYFEEGSMVGGTKRWTLRLGASEFHPTDIQVVEGQTVFIVVSIAFNTASTVSMFVNPASLGGAAPAPTMTKTTTAPLLIRSASFYGGNDVNSGSYDELRLGTSYASVTPVKR